LGIINVGDGKKQVNATLASLINYLVCCLSWNFQYISIDQHIFYHSLLKDVAS